MTWVGPPLPPPEQHLVGAGDVGTCLDLDGGPESLVVEFGGAVFCCRAEDVRVDPPPVVRHERRHDRR